MYICQVGNYNSLQGKNLLYINNGDLSFTESAEKVGLDFQGFSTQAAFFDYDKDGDLDMYLMNHSVHTPRSYRPKSENYKRDQYSSDILYKNLQVETGEFRFIDFSENAKLNPGPQGYGLGLAISDLNNDNWPDIYVGNDFHENDYYYLNNQDGTFSDSIYSAFRHTSRFTMGVDIGDINHDSNFDIMTLDMLPSDNQILMKSGGEDANKVAEIKLRFGYHPQFARNSLQINNGDGTYSDVALLTNTYATDWSWSTLLNDFDQDIQNDIFISNGIYKRPNDLDYINYVSNVNFSLYSQNEQDSIERELIKTMPSIKIPNYAFKGSENLQLLEVSKSWGLDEDSYSNGSAYADLDNDGDLEIIVNNVNGPAFIYENKSNKNFLQLEFAYDEGKFNSLGLKALLFVNGKVQVKENYPVRGFQSSVSHRITFGLDTLAGFDSLIVRWPDSKSSIYYLSDLKVNSLNQIKYEESGFKEVNTDKSNIPFNYSLTRLNFRHVEDRFNDYEVETLIPYKLSTEGPAIATEDINDNGLIDFYVGGAHGQSGQIFLQDINGDFYSKNSPALEDDADFEDTDAVFFDLENDGDLDLYVVSGGNVYSENSTILRDRIYRNNDGVWERLNLPLPATNGSVVVKMDYDDDGDTDLFVGSRSVPGSFGLNPVNFILENKGNSEINVQPLFNGMVTDAIFEDLDNDGRSELLVVGDWLPLTIISYQDEKWNKSVLLNNSGGFWNSLSFDKSSKKIWLGNQGLNSKLQIVEDIPITLYTGDFDRNGQIDPIIYYPNSGSQIPLMSRDDLIGQIPLLKKKFTKYKMFAGINSFEELIEGLPSQDYRAENIYIVSSGFVDIQDSAEFTEFDFFLQRYWINDIALNPRNNNLLAFGANFFGASSVLGNFDAGGLIIRDKAVYYPIVEMVDKQVNRVEWIDQSRLLIGVNNNYVYLLEIK